MLVLSRKRREKILLKIPAGPARDVWITIAELRDRTVLVGLEADPSIAVLRDEVADRDRSDAATQPQTAESEFAGNVLDIEHH